MKKEKAERYLNQRKVIELIDKAMKVGLKLPESSHKDAILGTLDAVLEEAKKPLPLSSKKTTLH